MIHTKFQAPEPSSAEEEVIISRTQDQCYIFNIKHLNLAIAHPFGKTCSFGSPCRIVRTLYQFVWVLLSLFGVEGGI